jgi:hypothetical protein
MILWDSIPTFGTRAGLVRVWTLIGINYSVIAPVHVELAFIQICLTPFHDDYVSDQDTIHVNSS